MRKKIYRNWNKHTSIDISHSNLLPSSQFHLMCYKAIPSCSVCVCVCEGILENVSFSCSQFKCSYRERYKYIATRLKEDEIDGNLIDVKQRRRKMRLNVLQI